MSKFCFGDDLEAIKRAQDYKELLEIALLILNRIKITCSGQPIAMVCGPISNGGTGSRKINLQIFGRAIERLALNGLLIFSQMPFEDDMERIYKSKPELQGLRLLEEFYLPIFESGDIKLLCFLPGWQRSIGANWEHEQAKRLKIPIIYLSDFYTRD